MIKKPELEEKVLLGRMGLGDQAAFKIIYEAYQSQVLTFANVYLKSRQHAEEIMQEVFLKLWNRKDKLNEINDLENYILTITRNTAFDTLRKLKREIRYMQPLEADNDVPENVTEESILLEDTRQLLEKGIDLLPPQQKRVYQLCHQQGLKYDEVATELGISPQTVHRHMKLALSSLRKYMSQHADLGVLLIIFKII